MYGEHCVLGREVLRSLPAGTFHTCDLIKGHWPFSSLLMEVTKTSISTALIFIKHSPFLFETISLKQRSSCPFGVKDDDDDNSNKNNNNNKFLFTWYCRLEKHFQVLYLIWILPTAL